MHLGDDSLFQAAAFFSIFAKQLAQKFKKVSHANYWQVLPVAATVALCSQKVRSAFARENEIPAGSQQLKMRSTIPMLFLL